MIVYVNLTVEFHGLSVALEDVEPLRVAVLEAARKLHPSAELEGDVDVTIEETAGCR